MASSTNIGELAMDIVIDSKQAVEALRMLAQQVGISEDELKRLLTTSEQTQKKLSGMGSAVKGGGASPTATGTESPVTPQDNITLAQYAELLGLSSEEVERLIQEEMILATQTQEGTATIHGLTVKLNVLTEELRYAAIGSREYLDIEQDLIQTKRQLEQATERVIGKERQHRAEVNEGTKSIRQFRSEQRTQDFILRESTQAITGLTFAMGMFLQGQSQGGAASKALNQSLLASITAMNGTEFALFGIGRAGAALPGILGTIATRIGALAGPIGIFVGLGAGFISMISQIDERAKKSAAEGLKDYEERLAGIEKRLIERLPQIEAADRERVQTELKQTEARIKLLERLKEAKEKGEEPLFIFDTDQIVKDAGFASEEIMANFLTMQEQVEKKDGEMRTASIKERIENLQKVTKGLASELAAIGNITVAPKPLITPEDADKAKAERKKRAEEIEAENKRLAQEAAAMVKAAEEGFISIEEARQAFALKNIRDRYEAERAEAENAFEANVRQIEQQFRIIVDNQGDIDAARREADEAIGAARQVRSDTIHQIEIDRTDEVARLRVANIENEDRRIQESYVLETSILRRMIDDGYLSKELGEQKLLQLRLSYEAQVEQRQQQRLQKELGTIIGMLNLMSSKLDDAGRKFLDTFVKVLQLAIQIAEQIKVSNKGGEFDELPIIGSLFSIFAGLFDEGGTVPGKRGQAKLAIVHGEETILPTHRFSFAEAIERTRGLPSYIDSREDVFDMRAFGNVSRKGNQELVSAIRELQINVNLLNTLSGQTFLRTEMPTYKQFENQKYVK